VIRIWPGLALILATAVLGVCLPERVLPELMDITASTGIRFKHLASPDKKYIVESMSGGVALIDYDRDG